MTPLQPDRAVFLAGLRRMFGAELLLRLTSTAASALSAAERSHSTRFRSPTPLIGDVTRYVGISVQ